jgi:isopenicillin-N epimerase
MGHGETMTARRVEHDDDWADLAGFWDIRADTTYLNHGSFGPSPEPVRLARQYWIEQLDCQPMDFFVRQLEGLHAQAIEKLAEFLGTAAGNLVFAENATVAMNVVAHSFQLRPGDEVLINDHEYGAVRRIWEAAVARQQARLVEIKLDRAAFESPQSLIDRLTAAVTDRTRLLVVSHITSPTAMIWPVEQIASAFRERGIPVCVDGPHAIAQLPLDLDSLDVDFYCASCHKWLCAPLGSGFLYVHPRQQSRMQPLVVSWGRLLPEKPARWNEEHIWLGTRDPSCYLALPEAIAFMKSVGLDEFRKRSYWLAQYIEDRLVEHFNTSPLAKRADGWYGSMAHVPLPRGDWSKLQDSLFRKFGIEVPIVNFQEQWFIRVSAHLYTTTRHLDSLMAALQSLMG